MTSPAAATARPAVLSDLIPGRVARDVALVAGAAVLTGIAAQISIPIPGTPVPVSMQPFAVLLAGAALGPVRAAAGMLLYLAVGMAGMPWFAEGASGWGMPTFGYILGFAAAATLVGALAKRGWDRSILGTVGAMALGTLAIYALGVPWLMGSTGMDLGTALAKGVVPFLVGDALKIALAAGILPAAWFLTSRRP
ncbi:biotin transporter BioY [Bailinhaonella thermotolerans]|uniref:Biotin transporter n=1 Tax=Bailinhaonella thermotolerans TaxID=1070861 RepID=A0A3A4B5Z0_9ACTN|nr:biotin transporter BioY [Bailinhaonella thermotolerans]RJL33461.1 biotin transporter BioY [Bailinhaonella thermotolerans]